MTVGNFAFLFNCKPVGRTSDSMTVPIFQGGTSFVDHSRYFCRVFVMVLCASVYCCLMVTCWERADLLALVCIVLL